MSRNDRRVRAGADRANLYDEVTDKIIAELEAGRVPWVQPWGTSAAKAPLGLPRNAATSRSYSGINVLILWGAVIEHGFPGQGWLTFRQALSLGGHVRNPRPLPRPCAGAHSPTSESRTLIHGRHRRHRHIPRDLHPLH
jgi:antirestriction protein ArdC